MTSIGPTDEIRIGVVGLGRGRTFAKDSDVFRTRLVAVCDVNEAKLKAFQEERPDVAGFTDFDEFIKFDMDAVVLTNFFHEHTPFAIKALRHGKHVMSETTAAKTLQEAVALCNEVESHDLTYMLAENYPYFATNQEMRRLYQQGVVGNVRYAEGEYTHPMQVEDAIRISPGASHWRNNMAPTYYCTHALAPLMYITDTVPVGVNGLVIQGGADETGASNGTKGGIRTSDPLAVTVCRMDNGAIFRLLLGGLGARRNYYRVHGFRGMLDNVDGDTVRVGRNDWELEPGEREHVEFKARFPSHEELATTAGHGGETSGPCMRSWRRYGRRSSLTSTSTGRCRCQRSRSSPGNRRWRRASRSRSRTSGRRRPGERLRKTTGPPGPRTTGMGSRGPAREGRSCRNPSRWRGPKRSGRRADTTA